MKTGRIYLGVDVGTTSLKTAAIDEEAQLLAISSSRYARIQEQPDYAQIDAESMWQAFLNCVRLLRDGKGIDIRGIAGIGISCLCPGLAAMGADGEVLVDPIIYSDRRSIREAEEILERVGNDRLFSLTANGSMAGAFSGSTMLWIKRHLPEVYEKARFFGHLNTYLAHRMTGEYAIDRSNASYTNLFETTGRLDWSGELCETIGIDRAKLPPVLHSSDVAGTLTDTELIGLGIPAGIPVVIGGGDTGCATYAAGVTKAGDACESVGTTDVLTVCVDKPLFDRGFLNRCHVVPGTWIYQGVMSYAGASNEWFLNRFCHDLIEEADDYGDAFRRSNAEAATAIPGCGGVIFLPYMQGERSPVWDPYARGVFFGVSLGTGRAEMNRAILEGCAYGLRQLTEIAERVTGLTFPSFLSIGGGAKSDVWAQIKADITGREIRVLDLCDMAPVGAALLGGVGAGEFGGVYEAPGRFRKKVYKVFTPSKAHSDVYTRRFETYLKLYPALADLFKSSADDNK